MRRNAMTSVLVGALLSTGCGRGDLPVSGTVTHGGRPADGGQVVFEPAPGSGIGGAGGGAVLAGGQFELNAEMSLRPGRYIVRVVPPPPRYGGDASDPTARQPPAWSTEVDVAPGRTTFAFDLPER